MRNDKVELKHKLQGQRGDPLEKCQGTTQQNFNDQLDVRFKGDRSEG